MMKNHRSKRETSFIARLVGCLCGCVFAVTSTQAQAPRFFGNAFFPTDTYVTAQTVADFNGDGIPDVATCNGYSPGTANILIGNGDGTFREALSYDAGEGPEDIAAADFDGDGNLDIVVADHGNNFDDPLYGGTVVSLQYGNGDGTFRDASLETGIAKAERTYSMTSIAADLNEDGWTDLYVASDSTPSLLLLNRHNSVFSEEGAERGVAFSADGAEQAGMGIAVGDFDLDGKLDIFKTHFSDDTNVLYKNDGKGNFTDVTLASGFGVETRYTCWGTGFADFDNNGWPDLAIVTGSVYPEVERGFPSYPLKTPRFIFRNLGNGKFEELIEEAGPGIAEPHCSRGCAFGDFDNDGDVDMVVINLNEPPSLLRNDVRNDHKWLKVFLIGTQSNRSAIGTRVIAKYGDKVQAQAVMGQSSFYSANDRRLHFGLGDSTHADLEIHWTNGLVEHFTAVEANRLVTIREGKGITKSILPTQAK